MRGKNAKESALQVPWNARITKYVGLISFGISVCKKPGGGTPPCPTVEAENEARQAGQFQAGDTRSEALCFSAKSPYNAPGEKERRTGSTLRSKASPAVAGVSLPLIRLLSSCEEQEFWRKLFGLSDRTDKRDGWAYRIRRRGIAS